MARTHIRCPERGVRADREARAEYAGQRSESKRKRKRKQQRKQKQSKAEQSKAKQSKAKQSRAEQEQSSRQATRRRDYATTAQARRAPLRSGQATVGQREWTPHGRARRARMQRVPCGMRALRCGCAAMQHRRATYTTPHAANTLAGNTVKGCAPHKAMQYIQSAVPAVSHARACDTGAGCTHSLQADAAPAGDGRSPRQSVVLSPRLCPCPSRRDAHVCWLRYARSAVPIGAIGAWRRTRWCRCVRGTPTHPPAETRPRRRLPPKQTQLWPKAALRCRTVRPQRIDPHHSPDAQPLGLSSAEHATADNHARHAHAVGISAACC